MAARLGGRQVGRAAGSQHPPRTAAAAVSRPLLLPVQACSKRRCGAAASALRQQCQHQPAVGARTQRAAPAGGRRGRQLTVAAVAMVNVDFASPSLLLGTGLIGCGVLLLNMRNLENKVSRDADIVVAAMVSIVGSTLIFQGWRLDPLLLLCQALTTSVAFWYGVETFRLRSKEADMMLLPPPSGGDGKDGQQQGQGLQLGQGQGQQLPFQQGATSSGYGQQQQQGGMYGLPPGQDAYYPWAEQQGQGQQPQQQYGQGPWGPGNTYAETIQYDYYGNPINPQPQAPMLPPQQQQQSGVAGWGRPEDLPSTAYSSSAAAWGASSDAFGQQPQPGGVGYGPSPSGANGNGAPNGAYGDQQQGRGGLYPSAGAPYALPAATTGSPGQAGQWGQPLQQPPGSSSSGAGGDQDLFGRPGWGDAAAAAAASAAAAAENGSGSGSGSYDGAAGGYYGGAGQRAADAGAAAGAGAPIRGGRGGQVSRLDLYDRAVDDWE